MSRDPQQELIPKESGGIVEHGDLVMRTHHDDECDGWIVREAIDRYHEGQPRRHVAYRPCDACRPQQYIEWVEKLREPLDDDITTAERVRARMRLEKTLRERDPYEKPIGRRDRTGELID